jgi:phosphohistidine phosphatase
VKTLILMRHGEADDADTDHERPLSQRGRLQCLEAVRELELAGHRPDRVLCSSALRAVQSARLVAEGLGYLPSLAPDESLYLAEPRGYLRALRACGSEVHTVLLVAHNPGLSELASRLSSVHVALHTAGYHVSQHGIEHWSDL